MLITSDWHIHSEHSYDASNPLSLIAENAAAQGLVNVGIADHLNFNDEKFLADIRNSAAGVKKAREKYPFMILGVELTPMERPEFEYVKKTGTREGYVPPVQSAPYDIELPMTKAELMELGVRYGVGAAHWRVDVPFGSKLKGDIDACIKEWYRQQLWLACDERVTVLGHPWYHGECLWYQDFSVIPHSMNADIAAALKENGKYVECNPGFFGAAKSTEKFRHQYAEFLREMFEQGIPVTYGSDSHHGYGDARGYADPYMRAAGFKDGDISGVAEKDFWF
jgi:histidinol phosphatase-like PHP family hydrolase